MIILSLDSTSVTASVAISENGVVLAENFINNGLTHSQTLMPMVEKTLTDSNKNIKDVDLFAITNGQGHLQVCELASHQLRVWQML